MIVFAFVCVLVFSMSRYHDLSCFYLSEGCDPIGYLAYPFIHASFVHLILNMIAILSFWNRLDRDSVRAFMVSLPISFPLATLVGVSTTPTVGSSGIAFTLVGTYLSSMLRDHGEKAFLRFLSLVSATMIAQALLSGGTVNWKIHTVSLCASTFISCLYMEWRKRRS